MTGVLLIRRWLLLVGRRHKAGAMLIVTRFPHHVNLFDINETHSLVVVLEVQDSLLDLYHLPAQA